MTDALTRQPDVDKIELGEISDSLGFLLRVAQIQVFERFFDSLGGHGLKPGEFTVLWVIGLNPGLRQGAVARILSIKPAHMTKLTGRLVDRGLVSRATPADDRRAVRLSLSPEGQRFVAANRTAFIEHHHDERNYLSPDEIETLIGLLKKLTGLDTHASQS